MNRALSSVALNIAEGSYRRTDKDFVHFLNQALTSLYEVVSILDLLYDDGYIIKEEKVQFLDRAENIAKQLSSFINSLKKNS